MPNKKSKRAVLITRVAFSAVFLINMQCALQFIMAPGVYAPAYELDGIPGNAAIQGIGVAFLMWNATYPFFIARPMKYRILGIIILIQQIIGLLGESAILILLPPGYEILSASITRFIVFDLAGALIMLVSFAYLSVKTKKR